MVARTRGDTLTDGTLTISSDYAKLEQKQLEAPIFAASCLSWRKIIWTRCDKLEEKPGRNSTIGQHVRSYRNNDPQIILPNYKLGRCIGRCCSGR